MFKEEIYEIAFGDNAINKDYSEEEVIKKIRYYSDISLDLLEACKYASELLLGHNLQYHNVYIVLQRAINKAEEGE